MAINFTPDDVASGFNLSKLNSNFDKVETALADALSRSGNGPNQMEADIDLNSNDLLNVGVVNAGALVLNGEVVTPDELQTVPSTVMLKSDYDPDAINEVLFAGLPIMPEAFGATFNGVDDKTAIEAAATYAVAHDRPLLLSPERVYTFSTLALPNGLKMMGSGSFRHNGNIVTGDIINVGVGSHIESIILTLAGHGNNIFDIRIGADSRVGYISTIADAQSEGETITTTGDNVYIGFHYAENCDRPLHVDNSTGLSLTSGFCLGGYEYVSYKRGIRLSATRFYQIGQGTMRGRSPNAIDEAPGYNSFLLASAPDGVIGDAVLEDSGEHCFRIGGNTGAGLVDTVRVTVGNLLIRKCSASAIKINPNYTARAKAIHFASVIGVDVGFTTGVTAKRSDGLRLSHCENISFGTVDFIAQDQATSSEVAIRLNNAKYVSIEYLGARFVESGVFAIDETADVDSGQGATQGGDVTNIHIGRIVGAKGAGIYPFSFSLPNHVMGDIKLHNLDITGLTTGLAAFDVVTTFNDILEFQGRVTTSSTASFANLPNNDSVRVDLRINGAHMYGAARQVVSNTSSSTVGSTPFDGGGTPTQLGGLFLQTQTGTASNGAFGPGLVLGRAGASGRRGAAIASKQTGASIQNMGLAFFSGGSLGGSDALTETVNITHEGAIAMLDGITAPATRLGWAQLYVDSADGDLKIKFGDGVVKTIVVDV